MEKIRSYIKKNRIEYKYLSQEMGYNAMHICHVLTGKAKPTEKFMRLLIPILSRIAYRKVEELEDLLKDTEWKELL